MYAYIYIYNIFKFRTCPPAPPTVCSASSVFRRDSFCRPRLPS